MEASVAASFSAAGLSFISVILGLRSHRRTDTEQWRRDIERPLVAEIIELSDACSERWKIAAAARQKFLETPPGEDPSHRRREEARKRMRDELQIATAEHRKLREKLAELDLVAGRGVRASARAFRELHYMYVTDLRMENPAAAYLRITANIPLRRSELLAAVRRDIGIDPKLSGAMALVRRSKWGRRLERRVQSFARRHGLYHSKRSLIMHGGGRGRFDMSVLEDPTQRVK